jgi:hypothetical protein
MGSEKTFSFKPYIENKAFSGILQAILAAARTREAACTGPIAEAMKDKSESWDLRGAAAEAYAVLAPGKAGHEIFRAFLEEMKGPDSDSLDSSFLYLAMTRALAFCWKDGLVPKILKHIEVPNGLDTDELWLYQRLIANSCGEEVWLDPLVKAYVRNLYNTSGRYNIAWLITLFERRRYSLSFHLLLLLDRSEKIRAEAYSNLHKFIAKKWMKEEWLRGYQPGLSPSETKDIVSRALTQLSTVQRFLYYNQTEGIATWSTEIDEDAFKQGTPIHPYTRQPLTKEEIEKQRKEEVELEKLLGQLRKKQEEAWKKLEENGKEKQPKEEK